jgi:flagellin
MTVINTNVNALNTQGALAANSRALATAMQQLSTGKRINSAKDDAAGMAISTRITQQVQALGQSIRNAGDAISLIQTAEGATNEITSMLQRMRELSIQAINDTNANEQRGYLDQEFQALKQQIVQIANSTEWNGFPILNGTAGQQVGPVPMIRTTGNGQFVPGLSYAAGSVTSNNAGTVTVSGDTPVKSGNLSVTVDATDATKAHAVLTLNDGSSVSFDGTVSSKAITFAGSALTGGSGNFVLTSTTAGSGTATDWAASDTASVSIGRTFGSLSPIVAGDVTLNGHIIPDTKADNDGLSTSGNAAGSAIAKVAAINSQSALTGVNATVGQTMMTGTAMSLSVLASSTPPSGSVTINGYNTAIFSSQHNNTQASRAIVVDAINKISGKTGVKATDTGGDAGGITLSAADGRNIEVAFNTASSATDFAAATGLKQGSQSGTYSLSAAVGTGLLIGSDTGAIARSGLQAGHFDENSSEVSTIARAPVDPTQSQSAAILRTGDLVINGVAIPQSQGITYPISGNPIPYEDASSALAIAAAINSQTAQTGVTAKAGAAAISGTTVTTSVPTTSSFAPMADGTPVVALMVNGTQVLVPMPASQDDRANAIVRAINSQVEGVTAQYNGGGKGIALSSDGRNLSVWFDASTGLSATDFGLNGNDVIAAASGADAITHFGGVNMYSTMPMAPFPLPASVAGSPTPPPPPNGKINVSAGSNGASAASNFGSLGFVAGTYGGASGMEMSAPRVGRLTFQIGASAGQVINVDFADFGSSGPITGSITKDAGSANPSVSIGTAAGATAVLASLDACMNNINDARANMGAVMNRLTHVIDNLSNVVTNSKQSLSQIQDADYATASTELARAQIIQQAGTAVLAQANTSAQSVLKLLQG